VQQQPVHRQAAIRLQVFRHCYRLIQVHASHALARLAQALRRADRPIHHVSGVLVRERRPGFGFVAQPEHMIGHGIAADAHVMVARAQGHVHDRLHALHLGGHHVLRSIRYQRRNRIRARLERMDVGKRDAEQRGIDVEHAPDYRLVSVMGSDQREILCGEEPYRLSRREHHRAEQHLERDVLVHVQQI